MKRMISFIVFLVVISACTPAGPGPVLVPTAFAVASRTVISSPTPTLLAGQTTTPLQPGVAQATTTPAETSAVQAPGDPLTPKYWREWPSVPQLSAHALKIIQAASANPAIDLHTFSRVGDCQLTTETFLAGYVTGKYVVPAGLTQTVEYFHQSMITDSISAANGLGINSVLNPMFAAGAGHNECGANETPLDCELRIRHPLVVVLAMGTNWKPNAEVSFEEHLRQVVEQILRSGALPILATKADDVEGDWKLNLAIAQVAYDDDLPLVNTWRAVQNLPNHGLEAPKNIYLTGDGWMARNQIWLQTLELVRVSLVQN